MNSKNIKRKQFDLYYAKYTSNKNLSAIISDIDKKMSDWIEIDLTGCNNKLGIFNKIINGKLVPISYFNKAWRKGDYFSVFRAEEEISYKNKKPIRLFLLIFEISEPNFSTIPELYNHSPYLIQYNLPFLFVNINILQCFVRNKKNNENFTQKDIKCDNELSKPKISTISFRKNEEFDLYSLEIELDSKFIKAISSKNSDNDYLFLMSKDHVITSSKICDLKINENDNKLIFSDDFNYRFRYVLDTHILFPFICCHEIMFSMSQNNMTSIEK